MEETRSIPWKRNSSSTKESNVTLSLSLEANAIDSHLKAEVKVEPRVEIDPPERGVCERARARLLQGAISIPYNLSFSIAPRSRVRSKSCSLFQVLIITGSAIFQNLLYLAIGPLYSYLLSQNPAIIGRNNFNPSFCYIQELLILAYGGLFMERIYLTLIANHNQRILFSA